MSLFYRSFMPSLLEFWIYHIRRGEWRCENGDTGLRKGLSTHNRVQKNGYHHGDLKRKRNGFDVNERRPFLALEERNGNGPASPSMVHADNNGMDSSDNGGGNARTSTSLKQSDHGGHKKASILPDFPYTMKQGRNATASTPTPRFAHQLVLDRTRQVSIKQRHYLFLNLINTLRYSICLGVIRVSLTNPECGWTTFGVFV